MIYSLIENPYAIDDFSFTFWNETEQKSDDTLYETIKLYVPKGKVDAYKATDGWKKFKNILEMADASPITITAEDKTIEYGEALPEFTYKSEGGELSGEPVISCEATATSPAGNYPIIVSKGMVENLHVTYVAGTLTIGKAPLTIKVGNYTKKQGEQNPEFALSYEGFKLDQTNEVLSKQPVVSCEANATSEPGEYPIVVSGAEADNYEISYVAGVLTITEADPVTVTANSYTITYGDPLPTFEYTSEGAALNGTPAITCEATANSPAGIYPITITKGTVTNYNVTYVNGILTINKGDQTISWEQNFDDIKVGDQVELTAISSSGLPITYIMDENTIAELYTVGNKTYLDCKAAGTVHIAATQEGNNNYNSSVRVRRFVTIGEPTGINQIENASFKGGTIYDLNGRKLNTPRKGINVIKGKKVVIK